MHGAHAILVHEHSTLTLPSPVVRDKFGIQLSDTCERTVGTNFVDTQL